MLGKLAILFIVWLVATTAVKPPKDIRITGGLVEGTQEAGLRVYRGIPFAAPPVGDLRWRPPQPVIPWHGVRVADQFADACPQGKVDENGHFGPDIGEDCLYLNVWTPAKTANASLPVMVWIHGGGFRSGATSIPVYSGEQLAKHGVVVVSVAYRLGVFGFMAWPGHASANFGLLDQIAALRWVKRNIRAFGGNPHKVTIFGESAGAMSVSLLAASPEAKGLFRGVIADSGAAFWAPSSGPVFHGGTIATLSSARKATEKLAMRVGATSLTQMRSLTAPQVLVAARGIAGIGWPIVDGQVVDGVQYDRYLAANYNRTPVLVGINSDEGFSFSQASSAMDYVASTHRRFGPFADKLLALYPATPAAWVQSSRDLLRDAGFGWPAWAWASLQAKTHGPPVYTYYFDQRPPYAADSPDAGARGAPHGAELPYVFGHLDLYKLQWRRSDRDISRAMQMYWTNFVKYGNPNGKHLPHWPAFKAGHEERMVFKGTPHASGYGSLNSLEVLGEWHAWLRSRMPASRQGE